MDPVMDFAVKPCFIRLKNVGAEKTVTLPKVKLAKEQKQLLLPTKKSKKTAVNGSKRENKSDGKSQKKISAFFSPRSKKKEIKVVGEEKKAIKKVVGKEKEDPASSYFGIRLSSPSNLNNMSNFGLALSPPATKPYKPLSGLIIPPKQQGLSSRGVNMVQASTLRTERSTKWSAGSGKVEKGQYNSWKDDIENREEDWESKMKSTYTNNKVPPKKVGLGLNEVKFGQISNNKGKYNGWKDDIEKREEEWDAKRKSTYTNNKVPPKKVGLGLNEVKFGQISNNKGQYNGWKDDIENKGKDRDKYNRTETSKANTQDEGLETDVLIRKANSLDLTKLKTELLSSPSIPEEFKKQSENLLIEYRRFLALKVILGDTSPPLSLSPSAIVDSVWHLHLLMPAHYFRCCKQLGEEVIDHDSSTARDHEDIRKKRLEMTKRSYKMAFGEAPPDRFWDLTYQHVTERESTSQNGPSDESLLPENETTYVNIKVLGIDGGDRNIKMRRTSTMAELENYLQKFTKDRMRLLYNDIRPFPRETPNSLNMVDGDVIQVYFEQSGC